MAWADFNKLARLWRHSSLTTHKTICIFQPVISTGLLYGLSTAWLNTSEQRRLNGFQARCLRKILGIRPAYYSRMTNRRVLEMANQVLYTTQLLKQQLILYGKIARSGPDDALRKVTFCPGSLRPIAEKYLRKVGRPRSEWASKLYPEAVRVAGSAAQLDTLLSSAENWRAKVGEVLAT